MTRILGMILAIALSLAAVAAVVYPLSDGHVLVPPPEAVGEGFVRALEMGRYSRALPYLSESARSRISIDELKQWTAAVERKYGKIQDVRGEGNSMEQQIVEAEVLIRTEGGWSALRFPMVREHALWKIARLPEEIS